jgi:hypothetical protein
VAHYSTLDAFAFGRRHSEGQVLREQIKKLANRSLDAQCGGFRVSERCALPLFLMIYAPLAALSPSTAGALGNSPPSRSPPALTGIEKQCNDAASQRIRATGRVYNSDRSGFNENTGMLDVWIGRYLFAVPASYVNMVIPGGTPGISAVLVATLPDMKVAQAPSAGQVDGVDPLLQITLTCAADLEYATVVHAASETREKLLGRYLGFVERSKLTTHTVPDLHLIGYQATPSPLTVYFPADARVRNPHGGAVWFECLQPLTSRPVHRAICVSSFVLREGVHVRLVLPQQFMKHWHRGYEGAVRLLESFVVEK